MDLYLAFSSIIVTIFLVLALFQFGTLLAFGIDEVA